MSNIDLIIEERPREVGNFLVGRLLPFHSKRMVGPFILIDHMGPVKMGINDNMDVPPHPHIGLSTLTYLFDGNIIHKDSIGTEIEIKPGQVNWMTAGSGIVHSERTPEYLRHKDKSAHGLQIWVALPKEFEQITPSFVHVNEEDLPHWVQDGLSYKLIAGEIFERKSPVPVYSPLYLLELKSKQSQSVKIGDKLYGECGLYILEGSVEIEGNKYASRELLVAKDSKVCEFIMEENTTVFFFGGEPFPEGRLIYWNFVATDQAHIDNAKAKWRAQEFAKIKGETDFVPLPLERK